MAAAVVAAATAAAIEAVSVDDVEQCYLVACLVRRDVIVWVFNG